MKKIAGNNNMLVGEYRELKGKIENDTQQAINENDQLCSCVLELVKEGLLIMTSSLDEDDTPKAFIPKGRDNPYVFYNEPGLCHQDPINDYYEISHCPLCGKGITLRAKVIQEGQESAVRRQSKGQKAMPGFKGTDGN